MKKIDKNNTSFEEIKHIDENGVEFWYARELMIILEYKQWRRFESVINKAKESCKNSDISVIEHFANVGKLSKRANNAEVKISDYKLSRYACYLIAQNGDSRKKVIALAQTYFAVQTRKQEITEKEANKTHYKIGKNIREVIAKNGGTMPENLPTPKKSLKQLEKESKNELRKK